jgi:pSer/pThr/pTyr-binding forkhead associated (FHA) protein
MDYKLVLLDTAEGVERVEWRLQLPTVVGRGRDVDVWIGHPSISRRHCQFALDAEGALVVRDLGSMNGTYIGDNRIREAVLMPGNLVRLGGITLRVDWSLGDGDGDGDYGTGSDVASTQPVEIVLPSRAEELAQAERERQAKNSH